MVKFTDERAAKPVTAVQDRVSTFQQVGRQSVRPEDNFPAVFVAPMQVFRAKT